MIYLLKNDIEMTSKFMQPIEMNKFKAGHRYECPVYYTLKQTIGRNGDLITRIWLPMKDNMNSTHWIKRGVALGFHNDE